MPFFSSFPNLKKMSNKKVSFFWICIFVQIDLTFFIHFKHVWMLYPKKKKTKVSVPNDLNFKYVRRFWQIWIFSRNIINFCFIYSLFFIFWLFVTIIIIFYLNGCWTWKGFGFVLEKKKSISLIVSQMRSMFLNNYYY